jgi:hypothetical protein
MCHLFHWDISKTKKSKRRFQPQKGIRDDPRDALLLSAALLIDQTSLARAWGVGIPGEPLTVENKYRHLFP